MRRAGGGGGDFVLALYLGMRHPWAALGPWTSLTTGIPAVLDEPPGAVRTARRLARLQGLEDGVLLPSTLHLFHDLFALLGPGASAVLVDAGAYAVARWGAARAGCAGVPVIRFAHHDGDALRRALGRIGRRGTPVVLCDGVCPGCGRPAPLADYAAAVRERGGLLVVDDTQALGILGAGADGHPPYGFGGGGSARWWGLDGPELVIGASLAKAFGAPVAALSGSAALVRRFRALPGTRMHGSPPSVAAVRAAARALALNRARGDALRARLADRIGTLRRMLADAGLGTTGGGFPVQTVTGLADPAAAHARLAAAGMRAVLRAAPGPALTLLLRADHTDDELARAAGALARAAGPDERSVRCGTQATTEGCGARPRATTGGARGAAAPTPRTPATTTRPRPAARGPAARAAAGPGA
ncbi:aminotransferase class I/II-fold pyridoxal phosphate-dependent enzyme [Longimicrobium sp.]|uniref:aminotransferase class I/II-fold pyridoxal phosphate-dependent enzyme n=1 Tax=Longimicrobium sp. TaxID=2029185 RepID=UPI002E348196|nr:aminotransferase class I/II-fold pyridoxal phosphate-dependent enzyme [Longimicrobium sp.]HEX6041288.1 aminotransferase class I/II-fold pyridoxal phosphate-dependent enzyme [Longimicrobium sp.]